MIAFYVKYTQINDMTEGWKVINFLGMLMSLLSIDNFIK